MSRGLDQQPSQEQRGNGFSTSTGYLLGFLAAGLVLAVVTAFVFATSRSESHGWPLAVGAAQTSSRAVDQAVTETSSALPEMPAPTSPAVPVTSSAKSTSAPPASSAPQAAAQSSTRVEQSSPPPASGTAAAPPTAPGATAPQPPATGPVCSASVSINQWPGGFVADVRITAGSSPVNGWAVVMTLPQGASITNVWNANRSGNTGTVRFTNVSYNAYLAPGQTIEFGYQATGTGTNKTPTCSAR